MLSSLFTYPRCRSLSQTIFFNTFQFTGGQLLKFSLHLYICVLQSLTFLFSASIGSSFRRAIVACSNSIKVISYSALPSCLRGFYLTSAEIDRDDASLISGSVAVVGEPEGMLASLSCLSAARVGLTLSIEESNCSLLVDGDDGADLSPITAVGTAIIVTFFCLVDLLLKICRSMTVLEFCSLILSSVLI